MGRHKQPIERHLRLEIQSCDKFENHYREKLARIKSLNWHWLEEETVSAINHYIDRRRYFLRQLIELQIKEFRRG